MVSLRQLLRHYAGKEPLGITQEDLSPEFAEAKTPNQGVASTDVSSWSDEWQFRFEERAAFMEVDGGLSREEAERRAQLALRESFKTQPLHGERE